MTADEARRLAMESLYRAEREREEYAKREAALGISYIDHIFQEPYQCETQSG